MSWVIAAALAAYVGFILFKLDMPGPFLARISIAFVMAVFPLSLIHFAALERVAGGHLNSVWVFAFVLLVGEALGSIELFNASKYAMGTLYVLAAVGIGVVLCYGLSIPQDP